MLIARIKYMLLIFLVLGYSTQLVAQSTTISGEQKEQLLTYEKLVRSLEQEGNHESAYDAAQQLVQIYDKAYPDSALIWINTAYHLAEELKDIQKQVFTLAQRSQFEFLTQAYDQSVSTALRAFVLTDAVPDDSLKCVILYRLAEGYEFTARPQQGMEKYLECYELAEKSGNRVMLARLDLKMGDIKQVNELYHAAKTYYKQALSRLDKNNPAHRTFYYQALYDIFNVSLKMSTLTKARSFAICDSVSFLLQECRVLNLERYTIRFAALEKLCVAEHGYVGKPLVLRTIEELESEIGDKTELYYQLFLNAKIALQQKKYKQALDYGKQCEQIGVEAQNIDIRSKGILLQKETYVALGNYEAAYQEMERYHIEKTKLAEAKRIESISQMEQQFAANQRETEILFLSKEKETLNTRVQLYSILSIAFGALLLLALAFFQKSRQKNNIIAEQNAALLEQKYKLENINNTRDKLFAIISHDLRNTGLVFQNISKKVNYLIDKERFDVLRQLAEEMDLTAFEFNKHLQNLLTWTLLQKGEMIQLPMEMNIKQASREILQNYQELANSKEVEIISNIDDRLKVNIDPQIFRGILLNLVDNAVKFSSKDDTVQVDISSRNTGDLILSVSDTGTGMSKERKDTLFSFNYMEAKRGTKGEKGVGFGLILVHELVSAYSGVIEVMSKEGQGSTFKVFLPSPQLT